jgi:hypothetical protein
MSRVSTAAAAVCIIGTTGNVGQRKLDFDEGQAHGRVDNPAFKPLYYDCRGRNCRERCVGVGVPLFEVHNYDEKKGVELVEVVRAESREPLENAGDN